MFRTLYWHYIKRVPYVVRNVITASTRKKKKNKFTRNVKKHSRNYQYPVLNMENRPYFQS